MPQKIYDNNLVAFHENKVTLTLNKPAYVRMCILELTKVLMKKFHYDYNKNKYSNKSRMLFTETDSLMYKIKTEDVYEDFSNDKEMFNFSNSSTKSKYYDNSNKLVVDKMEYTTRGVAIKEFFRLKRKMYSLLVDANSKHKKAKDVNKNVVLIKNHNEYKDFLFNKKYSTYSVNRIQSKYHRIGYNEINKISLS